MKWLIAERTSALWAAFRHFFLHCANVIPGPLYTSRLVRVAEVVQRHERPSPKSLDSDENFEPKHTLFCRKLRFVAIYALFGDLWAKRVPFWVKNSVSWARSALLHGIYCIYH